MSIVPVFLIVACMYVHKFIYAAYVGDYNPDRGGYMHFAVMMRASMRSSGATSNPP